mmetsp:Transcript_33201/g.77188  ORF Transcript_33201/g.77188 Transcript_33201/m.77188 type:complete len:236 (-) Transcript_33201:290-997(-)
MGTSFSTKRFRRAAARGSSETKNRSNPRAANCPGVSPGCTRAETKSTKRPGKKRGGAEGQPPSPACGKSGGNSSRLPCCDALQATAGGNRCRPQPLATLGAPVPWAVARWRASVRQRRKRKRCAAGGGNLAPGLSPHSSWRTPVLPASRGSVAAPQTSRGSRRRSTWFRARRRAGRCGSMSRSTRPCLPGKSSCPFRTRRCSQSVATSAWMGCSPSACSLHQRVPADWTCPASRG